MNTFYVINYKNLYLAHDDERTVDKTVCKWVRDKNEAIWFSEDDLAKRFACRYFKNFNNYSIIEVNAEAYI